MGISSSQLTFTPSFFRGVETQPPTRNVRAYVWPGQFLRAVTQYSKRLIVVYRCATVAQRPFRVPEVARWSMVWHFKANKMARTRQILSASARMGGWSPRLAKDPPTSDTGTRIYAIFTPYLPLKTELLNTIYHHVLAPKMVLQCANHLRFVPYFHGFYFTMFQSYLVGEFVGTFCKVLLPA